VPEYWVVKPQEKEIEVFQSGAASKIYTENEFLKTEFLPKSKLKIKQLFFS
jgi:Uma2 family endonuclease